MTSDVDIAPFVEKFESFYSTAISEKTNHFLSEYLVKRSMLVDYRELERYDRELADILILQPDTIINAAEIALVQSQEIAFRTAHPETLFEPHVRFFNLPETGLHILDIRAQHKGELISLKGIITKCRPIGAKLKVAVYQCQMCDATIKVPMTKNTVVPQVCGECKRRAFKLLDEDSYFVDAQEIELQELLEQPKEGTRGATISLLLESDLVNLVAQGDTVIMTGIVRLLPSQTSKTAKDRLIQHYKPSIDVVYLEKIKIPLKMEIRTDSKEETKTGKLDIDIITGGSRHLVEKTKAIMAIASRIQSQHGSIDISQLVEQARNEGVADEIMVRRMIDDLVYKGEFYKIKRGFLKITS